MLKRSLMNVILAILIVMSLTSIVFTTGLGLESNSKLSPLFRNINRDKYYEGEMIINTDEVWENETVYVNGNLTIVSPGSLKLINTTLKINYTDTLDFAYKITVQSEAKLEVLANSLIKPQYENSEYELHFASDSEGVIDDSTISLCGELSEQGLLIESDDVIIKKSILEENYIGIHCLGASPTIIDCEITDSENASVKCNNSVVKIENSTLEESTEFDIIITNNGKLTLLSSPLPSYDYLIINKSSELDVHWLLTVKVTNKTGDGIENASVEVTNLNGEQVYFEQTDADGFVENLECVDYINNGTNVTKLTPHTITVNKEGYLANIEKKNITEDTQVEIELKLEPLAGTIKGYVKKPDGFPITDTLKVSLYIPATEQNISTETDSEGYYEFTNIPKGIGYAVSVAGMVDNISKYPSKDNDSVSVEPDMTTFVNFTLEENPLPVTVQVQSWSAWEPVADASDVDVGTSILVTFDVPMNNTTVNGNNLFLQTGATKIPITISVVDADTHKIFELSPVEDLEKDTTYSFTITKDVKRLTKDGSVFWDDYVIFFDTQFEPVEEIHPTADAIEVDPVSPNIFIRFDDRISLNKDSLERNFGLMDYTNSPVAGTIDVDHITTKASFIPTDTLEKGKVYTVHIEDGLLDDSDELIFRTGDSRTWSFTTMVPTTTEITGSVVDSETGKPIPNATVKLYDENDLPIGLPVTTDETGEFAFTDLEPDINYIVKIKIEGYETIERTIKPTIDSPGVLDGVEIPKKAEEKKDDEEEIAIDPMIVGVIILVIVIIIIIILLLLMRKPREEEFEEEEEAAPAFGARVAPPTRTVSTTPVSRPSYEETFRPTRMAAPPAPSMNRCPMCGHRLNTAGECFRCNQAMKYGL